MLTTNIFPFILFLIEFYLIVDLSVNKQSTCTMALAASYDPLYPVRAAYRVSLDIVELVEIDIYQFLISTNGKRAVFRHLQNRLLKVRTSGLTLYCLMTQFSLLQAIKFDQNVFILILSVFAILMTLELIGRIVEWWVEIPEDLDPLEDGEEDAPDVGQPMANNAEQASTRWV